MSEPELDPIERRRAMLGPELIELLLEGRRGLPNLWLRWPADRGFEYIRSRLRFTQDELSMKAGLTQKQISRIEGGGDCKLSTWRKLYAAMGFELVLLPVTRKTLKELEEFGEEGRTRKAARIQRCRPRRRWKKNDDGTVTDTTWKDEWEEPF